MVNINEVNDPELNKKIDEHEQIGGALRIHVFQISENYLKEFPSEYDAHLATARGILEIENFKWNNHCNKVASKNQRSTFPIAITDYDQLDTSGKSIGLEEFLGPHFNRTQQKPYIRGQLNNDTINSYFFYDTQETPDLKVDMNEIIELFNEKYPDSTGYFIHALMEPPYNLNLGKSIKDRGNYLIDFLNYFFDDLNNLLIYSWDTNCSYVFDCGKEWWGSYFWTIYNPAKNWYIGIIASETD